MKKKVSVLLVVCVIAVLTYGCGLFYGTKSYSDAKKACSSFLKKNKEEMVKIAQNALDDASSSSGSFKDHYYTVYDGKQVEFYIDAQGMLGGQYWYLIYCPTGTYCGESEEYFWKEEGGNNIIKAEKIDDYWWYYWIDYDGTEYSFK